MSVFSVSGSNNDFYSMFFNTSGSNNKNNSAGLFGGGNSALGDMSLIKSGAYKKLLNSYYATVKESEAEEGKGTTTAKASAAKDSAGSLQTVSSDATELLDALKELGNRSLYKNKTDESGNKILGEKGEAVYDTEKINSAAVECTPATPA